MAPRAADQRQDHHAAAAPRRPAARRRGGSVRASAASASAPSAPSSDEPPFAGRAVQQALGVVDGSRASATEQHDQRAPALGDAAHATPMPSMAATAGVKPST